MRGVNAKAPCPRGSIALKLGPMFDRWRTRARAAGAGTLRPVFVVFMGLTLVQMLSECTFPTARPDLAETAPPFQGTDARRRTIELDTLGPDQSIVLLTDLLGDADLDVPAIRNAREALSTAESQGSSRSRWGM